MVFYYNPKTKQLEHQIDSEFAAIVATLASVQLIPSRQPLSPAEAIYLLVKKFLQPGSLDGTDAENIATIIQAGKDNGVAEIEIEMDREVVQGLDIGALQDLTGINLTLGQKGKSRYQIKVKYKN